MTFTYSIDDEIERLLSPRTVEALGKIVDLLNNLNESGLLDAIFHLADSEIIGELAKVILTTDLVRAINGVENLLKLAGELSNEDTVVALNKAMDLVKALDRIGIMDSLNDLLKEPELVSDVSRAVLSTGLIHLLNNLDEVSNALAAIDFKSLSTLLSALAGLTKKMEPTDVFSSLRRLLSNDDAKRGLAMVINALEKLGASSENASQ